MLLLLFTYASLFNLDPNLVIATAKVESSLDHSKVGPVGELGVMQLNPTSYPRFTKEELLDVRTNIVLGIIHIKEMKKRCGNLGDIEFMVCYNRGEAGANRLRYPHMDSYVLKIKKEMEHGTSAL